MCLVILCHELNSDETKRSTDNADGNDVRIVFDEAVRRKIEHHFSVSKTRNTAEVSRCVVDDGIGQLVQIVIVNLDRNEPEKIRGTVESEIERRMVVLSDVRDILHIVFENDKLNVGVRSVFEKNIAFATVSQIVESVAGHLRRHHPRSGGGHDQQLVRQTIVLNMLL